jgi:flagellar protein FliT
MAPDDGHALHGRDDLGSRRLIERYQEVARVSREMVLAAHREDWRELAQLEAHCQVLIGDLKRAATIEPLSAYEQQRRIKLLRVILQHDAQIRSRAEPWLLELERLIGLPPHGERSD